MGDLGGSPRPPGTKPRPLGQVKTEILQFQTAPGTLATRPSLFLPVPSYPELRRGPGSEEGVLRASIRSMREIRENLRQAALVNIVAAANGDKEPSFHYYHHHHHHHHHHPAAGPPPPTPAHDLRLHFLGTSPGQLVPPHHHQPLHPASPLPLQMTNNGSSPFPQSTEGAGRSAGSGTYHSMKRDSDSSPLPQNLVANLLSPRMRTISIPRPGPRVTDLSGPFIHKSLTQAKECLSRVGEMVRSRTEGVLASDGGKGAVANEVVPFTGQAVVNEIVADTSSHQRSAAPFQGQTLETFPSAVNGDLVRVTSASPNKVGSARSGVASTTTTTTTSVTLPPHSASSSRTVTDGRGGGSRKASGRSSEDRSSSAPRALSVRRHLSPGKKRELVKRLTEMAKCEAVDMSNPLGMQENNESRFMPPMIILSQQRQEIRCPEESPRPSVQLSGPSLVDSVGSSSIHRAKSISSLNHPHTYPAPSRDGLSGQPEGHSPERTGRLLRAPSGSMPDLVMEGGAPCSASNQRDLKRTDSSDWTTVPHTFMDGIVGKTLMKEKETGDSRRPADSRPLLPSTPKYRSRRSTRPSSRRSTLGLRDRAPLDTPTATATTTTTTTILSLSPSNQNRFKPNHGTSTPSQPPPPSTQNLPVLTITGLNRERPPPGTPSSNSRAARELRPTSRAGVTGSLQFYQQLDDQCEKLQRQLNISFNMPPRRAPHWQSGTIPSTAMTLNRGGLSSSHHAMSLPDGPEDVDASATSPFYHPHLRMDPAMAPLSDVDEQSHVDTTHTAAEDSSVLHNGLLERTSHGDMSVMSSHSKDRKGGSSGPQSDTVDPVLKSKKEPRYQGFSSRVPESEVRSQFHYVTPGSVAESEAAEEEREMKYRVLKALDQDVYYDFQHRKYRNTPGSTPIVRCNNEQDRPRVHFYKVKVNGET